MKQARINSRPRIKRDKILKDITKKNTQEITDTETVTLEDMSKEQLIDLIYELADECDEDDDDCCCCHCHDDEDGDGDIVDPVIGFDLDNVIDSEFDAEEFKKGIKSMSFIAGQLMALQNAGIAAQNALEYIHANNVQNGDCECTLKVAELQAKMGEKADKKTLIESKKNMA